MWELVKDFLLVSMGMGIGIVLMCILNVGKEADCEMKQLSVYQLNELDFMYRQLSSDMQEEYVSLLTVFENLEALYICRNVITVYPDCKSMIDVASSNV